MSLNIPPESLRRPGSIEARDRIEATYSCGIRHQDGLYRHTKKADVDDAIDRKLLGQLRQHPSWATAAEIEPSSAALDRYARYLTAKIATYDAHIGAAGNAPELSNQRASLESTLKQVAAMLDKGSFATAGLHGNSWYFTTGADFTDLARWLLTSRVDVSPDRIDVSTPFDPGAPLYRTLRAGEIREELGKLQRRQQELTEELSALGN
jgi:hypothetical protein